MSKTRRVDIVKTKPLPVVTPDLRQLGVVVAQEDDGSWFDLGRHGELEALGVSAMHRAQRARDELIRRAAIVCARLDRNTTIQDLSAMGVQGLRQKGIEFVLEPVKDIFVIYEHGPNGRGEAMFWTFFAITILHPGGDVQWVRLPDENPEARVQIRVGGRPEVLGAIKEIDWHSQSNSIWSENDGQ